MVWWVKHITSETQWWTIPMSSALGIYEIVPLLVAGNPSNIVWEFSFSILSTIPYRMELLDMYQCSKPLFFFTGYKHYTDIIHTLYIHYTYMHACLHACMHPSNQTYIHTYIYIYSTAILRAQWLHRNDQTKMPSLLQPLPRAQGENTP
jgi:hypothetical protein